jgi:predicted RNA polymerase sigma factor
LQLLDLSANGSELSEYHVEAGIAAVHASAPSVQSTNWGEIGGRMENSKILGDSCAGCTRSELAHSIGECSMSR